MKLPLEFCDLPAGELRARLDWAKRQGRPGWLWPEISVRDWRSALISIQDVSSAILVGDSRTTLRGEPSAIGLACYTSGMGPLFGWWHANGRLEASDEIGRLLALHLEHNRMRSQNMREAASALTETLTARGIGVMTLKGANTGERYFPDSAARPASDIDLLVAPRDAVGAEHVLSGEGYRLLKRSPRESDWRRSDVSDEPRSLLLVHADDPWSIDLHVSLNIELAAGLGVLNLDDANPMAGGNGGLSQPLLLVYLAAHASTGLHNLRLLRLVELHFVIEKDESRRELDWDRFLLLCRRLNALGAVWPALKLTEDLASGTVPEMVLRECAAAAPPRIRSILASLTPATAHRVGGTSIRQHFMWAKGPGQVLRQLGADLLPGRSWKDIRGAYARRFWQVARGTISR